MMPPLDRPETLTANVVSYIRDAVVRGEIKPDTPLPEQRLARELATSRGTIRVALRSLEELGLVEIVPHRGAFVTSLNPRRAWEIYSLRAVLEGYATRLVLEQAGGPGDRLTPIAAAVREMERAGKTDDATATIDAVLEFHCLIAESSGHRLLAAELSNLRLQTRRLILYTGLLPDPIGEADSHRGVLDALRTGDAVGAERAMYEHLMGSAEKLVARMEQLQPGR